jgi:hypothetical protein
MYIYIIHQNGFVSEKGIPLLSKLQKLMINPGIWGSPVSGKPTKQKVARQNLEITPSIVRIGLEVYGYNFQAKRFCGAWI